MRFPTTGRRGIRRLLIALLVLGAASFASAAKERASSAGPAGAAHRSSDPTRVVGPRECSECHEPETEVWRATHHEIASDPLPRNPDAKRMAQALGIRRIKADDRCTRCHYTVQSVPDKRPKAIAGVSCESCHGAAADWLEPHADFGGVDRSPQNETPAHRVERLARSDAAGLVRPGRLYELASRCYSCHTIDDAELVEVAGHPVDEDFELVAWSQGEIRHNFVRGAQENGANGNAQSSAERKRVMYVLGWALSLEHGLSRLAQIGDERSGAYPEAMVATVERALDRLEAIEELASIVEVAEMRRIARSVESGGGSAQSLSEAALAIGVAARRFEAEHDGSELAALDALVPKPGSYR